MSEAKHNQDKHLTLTFQSHSFLLSQYAQDAMRFMFLNLTEEKITINKRDVLFVVMLGAINA